MTRLHPIRPVDVNGINKVAGESYHLLYDTCTASAPCALRLTNTYGPGMRVKDARQTFLGIWIGSCSRASRSRCSATACSLRDFKYVDDCVEALLLAQHGDVANGKVYNLGSSEVISLRDLAELLIGVAGEGSFELVPFPPDRKQIDIGDYYGSTARIEADLGWRPRVAAARRAWPARWSSTGTTRRTTGTPRDQMNDFSAEPAELRAAMRGASTGWPPRDHYVLGPEVDAFEAAWAAGVRARSTPSASPTASTRSRSPCGRWESVPATRSSRPR